VDERQMRHLVATAPVGRLATVDADGRPHLVPVCFALLDTTAYSAIDHKPKTTTQLRRLQNLRDTGVACLLVDHYEADWSRLWWVRLDGVGRVLASGAEPGSDQHTERQQALDALSTKYQQYTERPPTGPVLALDVTTWRGWSAQPAGSATSSTANDCWT
jgi:PPOX class probable F420-dependent enzyme